MSLVAVATTVLHLAGRVVLALLLAVLLVAYGALALLLSVAAAPVFGGPGPAPRPARPGPARRTRAPVAAREREVDSGGPTVDNAAHVMLDMKDRPTQLENLLLT